MKKTIRRIKIRRGTDDQRKLVIFEEGEPVFIKDKKQVYIGDNQTYGGIKATHRNIITDSTSKPPEANEFDIIYFESTKDAKIVDRDGSLLPIVTNVTNCCARIQAQIDDITNILNKLQTECCNPDIRLVTDDEIDILTDSGDWFRA
jgi:hypothetical protein